MDDAIDLTRFLQRVEHAAPSLMSAHDAPCCVEAREWFITLDHSLRLNGDAEGPRWVRDRFTWGPMRWPAYWCEAMSAKHLDCGAFAAIARELFAVRGAEALSVQLVQSFPPHNTRQWHFRWTNSKSSAHWISMELVYHEACAIVGAEGELRVWDATDAAWISPRQLEGYASFVALKLTARDSLPLREVIWGEHRFALSKWTIIDE